MCMRAAAQRPCPCHMHCACPSRLAAFSSMSAACVPYVDKATPLRHVLMLAAPLGSITLRQIAGASTVVVSSSSRSILLAHTIVVQVKSTLFGLNYSSCCMLAAVQLNKAYSWCRCMPLTYTTVVLAHAVLLVIIATPAWHPRCLK